MTEPSYPYLTAALASLAEDAVPTDLTARALGTSRRLGVVRAAGTALAVLALLGGGVATVRMLPASHAQSAAGGINSPPTAGTPPCASATGVPVDPGPSPQAGQTETGPAPKTGPLFYLQSAGGPTLRLVSWTPGEHAPVLRRELPADARLNANVSPDGRWVSWVALSHGDLHVAPLTGNGTDRVLRTGVDGWQLEPVWTRDSTRLLIRDQASGRVGTIDVAHGAFTALPTNLVGARHAVWASDGSAIAFIAPDGAVVVAKPDGSAQRRLPADPTRPAGWQVASLQSMSGTPTVQGLSATPAPEAEIDMYLVHGTPDGCRSLISNTQVRMSTGRAGLDEAQRGGVRGPFQAAYRGGYFAHVDRALANPRTIELIGANGEFQGGVDEPAALSGYLLLNG